MKVIVRTLTTLLVGAIAGCAVSPRPEAQGASAPSPSEMKGCFYAGQLFSIGSVKPSMTAVPTDGGGSFMVDDPSTAVLQTCVMQFDGTNTSYVWIVAARPPNTSLERTRDR
jgi:hypothetical protein